MAPQPFEPWPLVQFLNLYTVGRTPWSGEPVARPLPTHRATQTRNKRAQTSMPRMGFEPTNPVFEQVKMVHGLDRAATVTVLLIKLLRYVKFCIKTYRNVPTGSV
jgi:hypothetical protein